VIEKLEPLKFNPTEKNDFLARLRDRVNSYFTSNQLSKKCNKQMMLKSLIMLALYVFPFAIYIAWNPPLSISIVLWLIMAIGVSGIGMCVMHDANHGAYVHSYQWNQWIGKIINLLGGSAFNWKIQHNILHHTYTNIAHYDDDIDDKAILKLSPHAPSRWYHKFQHYYAFLFYSIATLYWCTIKDFIQLNRYTKEGLNKNSRTENLWLCINLILSKASYFAFLFLLPYFFGAIPMAKTGICFICMHILSGLILTTVFQLAHTVQGTVYPTPTLEHSIERNWAVHQMETTCNFARKSRYISWWVGGLNFQIEHHLFPNICHVHYPHLAPIVKQTAEEYGIPYMEFDTVKAAFQAHVLALKNFSN